MTTAPTPPTPEAPVQVRRVRSADRFTPRPTPEPGSEATGETVVARNIFGERRAAKPQISRERVIAGDLPDWEPLPSGELQVVRKR